MPKYTPMIEQYLAVKREVQDTLLFFRLGDFYEMFFEDALLASKVLDITLTGREGGMEERIPMCGVPYHAADNYIARLIEKGYKVAICEQMEDPAEAKGVVKREIVRIVTPGTVMESKSLKDGSNNYIGCIAERDGQFGLTICDISTGELFATALDHSLELLLDELNAYMPSEIICGPSLLRQVEGEAAKWPRSALFTRWDKADMHLPRQHFDEAELAPLSPACELSVSMLLTYLKETQKRSLSHLRHIRAYEHSGYMTLDPFTRRNLELVETVRDRSKKGSLLWLLDKTATPMGGRMLRRWIDKPLMNAGEIEARLEAVDKLVHRLIAREELRQQLGEIYDLERLGARISYGNANGRDLIALMHSLRQAPLLKQIAASSESATLQRIMEHMDECRDVMEWIGASIVEEPPVSIRDGGMIKPGCDAYLDQLKEASAHGKEWLAELEKREREATGIKSLKVGFNKVFGYYIEVTRAHLGNLPEGRYERKQTLANAERFITPELKEKERLILEAEEKMIDIEYELFQQLCRRIAEQMDRIQQLAEMIAQLDVFQSLAAVSAQRRYCRPKIHKGYDLSIVDGRHPVVEAVMEERAFVANETELTEKQGKMLLITGPNMAGKSTYMRQVAMICIMAQIGCFVPAKEAHVPIVDRIFTRIGAADDLIGGQSTFMVEMMDIQAMTEKATRQSLVIIDELGRGTSTDEGMAIAQAVIEFLHDHIGCKTLVSTHFHELAHLEDSLRHLFNYSMAVKESGRQVTFLRKLVRGAASSSYGIYCAQIAGLPESIIARSYTLLSAHEARAAALAGPSAAEAEAAAGSEPSAASAPPAVMQISLFGQDEPVRKTEKQPGARHMALLEQLKKADLLNMTPLQAMNFLHEIKNKLTEG